MTTDQIIQSCHVVALTAGLLTIAYTLYLVSKALELRAMPAPAPGMPPMDPEKIKKQMDELREILIERAKKQNDEKAERHGRPPADLMRPPRHVIKQ